MKPDNNASRKKFNDSVARTVERYEGTLALMATWEQSGGDNRIYLQELRAKSTKLRAQLRCKGVLFGDVDD